MGKNDENGALILRNDVYQSNPLIRARKDFDAVATRIFLIGLRGLNPRFSAKDKYFDADFKEMFVPTNRLTELFGGNTWYLHDLEKVCDKMFHTVIRIRPEDGGFELYHLFRKLKYVPNEGLYIWFEELLRPYILDLFESEGYTKLNVKYLFSLSSPYAVRLLELLLQYQNIKTFKTTREIKRRMTVEEIRFALNVPDGAYNDRINNFRKFVLDNPIREINERTPYVVRYDVVKKGRTVVAFDFVMDTFNVPAEDLEGHKPELGSEAVDLLISLGFSEKAARVIFSKCNDVQDCFLRVNRARALLGRQRKPVKNELGFLRKAIEGDWQVDGRASAGKSSGDGKPGDGSGKSIPAAKARAVRLGRKKMPYLVAKTYVEYIKKGEHLEIINESLKEFGVTIKGFEDVCKKRGI